LEWDPPVRPNGDITHYMVKWQPFLGDSSAVAGHVCDDKAGAGRRHFRDPHRVTLAVPSATEQPVCSKQPGCCDCSSLKKTDSVDISAEEMEKNGEAAFENAVQNLVFVQHCSAANKNARYCGRVRKRIGVELAADDSSLAAVSVDENQKHSEQNGNSPSKDSRSHIFVELASAGGATVLRRLRRHRHHRHSTLWLQNDTNRNGGGSRRVRRGRRAISSPAIVSPTEKLYGDQKAILITQNEVNESLSIYRAEVDTATHKINVTTTHLTITGLRHYTQYQVWIHACQNVSAPGGYHCSQRPGYLVVQTAPIPENDLVDNSTIEVINATVPDVDHLRTRKITWVEPSNPNGMILAYKVKVIAEDREQTPVAQCIKASEFRHQGGVTFRGLSDGIYRVEVRTITIASLALASTDEVAVAHSLFTVFRQPFFTKWVIALIIFIIFLVLTIGALIAYYFSQKIFGKKVQEYMRQQISANPEYLSQMDVYKADEWELKRSDIHLEEEIGRGTFGKVQEYMRQQISANPEYLSQMDVYKADEWELKRSDIHLEEEIGRGTFGKVYRGYANDVVSHGGVHFGECAVKTVAESANSAERVHFLIEASVMKQFHTSFIVKLYGVVSDGQPVLVVMELMKKGNLRDYLRSRRPCAEENLDNLPIPTNREYVRWAAQIADGMAYLESIKFCHRDLAARNCMASFVASTAGNATYEESEVDEVFQPKEVYPPIADDSELVMNEDVVPGDRDERPICNWNRRTAGSGFRRGASSERRTGGLDLEMSVAKAENEEDEL
ncbi:Insulin-like receptor, partial [Toxocara canis]